MERPLSGRYEFCEWQERLKRFEASGLSIDAFCRQEAVGRSTFVDWLQTLKKTIDNDVSERTLRHQAITSVKVQLNHG